MEGRGRRIPFFSALASLLKRDKNREPWRKERKRKKKEDKVTSKRGWAGTIIRSSHIASRRYSKIPRFR